MLQSPGTSEKGKQLVKYQLAATDKNVKIIRAKVFISVLIIRL